MLAASSVTWGGFEWSGDFTAVDLIAVGVSFVIAFTLRDLGLLVEDKTS